MLLSTPIKTKCNYRNEHHFKGMLNKQEMPLQTHMENFQNWMSTEMNLLDEKITKQIALQAFLGKDDGSSGDRCKTFTKNSKQSGRHEREALWSSFVMQ